MGLGPDIVRSIQFHLHSHSPLHKLSPSSQCSLQRKLRWITRLDGRSIKFHLISRLHFQYWIMQMSTIHRTWLLHFQTTLHLKPDVPVKYLFTERPIRAFNEVKRREYNLSVVPDFTQILKCSKTVICVKERTKRKNHFYVPAIFTSFIGEKILLTWQVLKVEIKY